MGKGGCELRKLFGGKRKRRILERSKAYIRVVGVGVAVHYSKSHQCMRAMSQTSKVR